MNEEILPLEETDPELAELLKWVVNINKDYPPGKRPIVVDSSGEVYIRQQAKTEKVGRNNPCPCGSGKKYKKCCGR